MFPFRESHLFTILKAYESKPIPLDTFLRNYFRAIKAIGSKDRRYIAETVYGMMRWRGLLDHLCEKPVSWEKRYELFKKFNLCDYIDDDTIPHHIRVSFPKIFFQMIEKKYGLDQTLKLCLASNTEAPTTVRANTLKTTRDELFEKWKTIYSVSPCEQSPNGIVFHRKINFFALPEFKEGLFEVQDEGSQLIAGLVDAKPGQHILDFCAGSGGKSLAFAPFMEKKGRIYLHDIRPLALEEAKKRMKRAGVQNAGVFDLKEKRKMDWILVDAPCSGSGTLRRNPDMKWKFEPQMVERLVQEQRKIFEQALEYLHPEGKIVYATCSLFFEENEEQIDYFQNKFNLKLKHFPFKSFPTKGGMDGFFGAVLSKI